MQQQMVMVSLQVALFL